MSRRCGSCFSSRSRSSFPVGQQPIIATMPYESHDASSARALGELPEQRIVPQRARMITVSGRPCILSQSP